MVLERLGYMNEAAEEIFDLMDEEDGKSACSAEAVPSRDLLKNSDSFKKASYYESPHTPTSVLPDTNIYSLNIQGFPTVSYMPSLLLPLRLMATGKLKPIDIKRLSFHMLPHVSLPNFNLVNQIEKTSDASEPKNCEAISNSEVLPVNVTTSSVNSMAEMDETEEVLNPVLHSVASEKADDSGTRPTKRRAISTNSEPPSMLLAKESALPSIPQPQPQRMLPPIQTIPQHRLSPLMPNHSTPPAPHSPMLLPKRYSPPLPPPPPPTPTHFAPPALNLPMLTPKKSSAPPSKQSALPSPLAPMLPPKESTENAVPLPSMPLVPPKESAFQPPAPPPPLSLSKGSSPPPPPPLGANKALRPKKMNTKLKRSTQMGSLYRLLKGKVEGCTLSGKLSNAKMSPVGVSAENKAQGMADALAEMTKRCLFSILLL